MIQRIQTIFLTLIVILSVLMLYAPVGSVFYESQAYTFYPIPHETTSILEIPFYIHVPVLILFVGIFALIEIFAYKKRPLQLKIGNFNNVLMLLTVVTCFFYMDSLSAVFGQDAKTEYGWGIYIPFVQLVLNIFASRFIKKDEELVKSLDRIR
jgi:hypothetical protein